MLFSHCINLKKISLLNTENVLNMKSMFYKCENLKYFPNLNIDKVTDISFMFSNCKKLRKCYFYQKINELNKNSNRCFENCDLLEKLENHKEFKLKRKEENTKRRKENIFKLKKEKLKENMYKQMIHKGIINDLSI